MVDEIKTFADIQNAIIRRAKLEAGNSKVLTTIRESINTVYQEITFYEEYWWTRKTRPLILQGKYTTGTGTIVATKGSNKFTGTGTAWDAIAHTGMKARIGTLQDPYTVLRVDDATTITCEHPWLLASTTTLDYFFFRDEYGMPPDCHALRRFRLQTLAIKRQPLPEGFTILNRQRDRSPFQSGNPVMYTQSGHNIYAEKTWADFLIDTDFFEDDLTKNRARNKNLIVWPGVLNQDELAILEYTQITPPMILDADEPLIPYENRPVLVYGVLVDNFLKNRDAQTTSFWKSKYKEYKKKLASDIETTDDSLTLLVDREGFSRRSRYAGIFEDNLAIT